MLLVFSRLRRMFRPATNIPAAYQKTFAHLFYDIAWFGILGGTTIAFLAVFATRQGASTTQIGMLSAVPALVNLLFALPAANWLNRNAVGRAVFWTSVLQRVFYLLLIPLPVLLMPKGQVWAILLMTLLMNVPGTYMLVGFNALFGEVVPVEWRGYVVGIRNALLAVTSTVFTLLSGEILQRVAFPLGYQIVFALGLVGAAASSYHLYRLSLLVGRQGAVQKPVSAGNGEGTVNRKLALEIRALYQRGLQNLRMDAMRGPYARVMGLLFFWHTMQFMAIPTFTPFVVNVLHLSDQTIGFAAAIFNTLTFVGSLQLNRLTRRYSNQRVMGSGMLGMAFFPILTSLGPVGYLFGNLVGGFFWAMTGGALYNYILEKAPADDRPAYLAWYNLVSNAAILVGSLSGPLIAGRIGFPTALMLFGIGRFLAGVAILKWG